MNAGNTQNADGPAEERYRVVVNHEEQYSIWPVRAELPAGWRDAGRQGTRQECLAHVEQVWTDMRPLSLRRLMAQSAERPAGTTA